MSRSESHSRAARLALLLLMAAAVATFFALDGPSYLTLETIKSQRDALLALTEEHTLLAALVAMALYTLSTALSLPGATVLSLVVGFLFGRWLGTALILVSATAGATLVFLAARYLFAEAARRRLEGSRAAALIEGFERDAFNYLLFLRLVPLFPFWLVNLAPAFTAIRLRTYIAATAIGILPGCFVFANLGQSLGRIDSLDQLLSLQTLLALALLGALALIPVVARRRRAT